MALSNATGIYLIFFSSVEISYTIHFILLDKEFTKNRHNSKRILKWVSERKLNAENILSNWMNTLTHFTEFGFNNIFLFFSRIFFDNVKFIAGFNLLRFKSLNKNVWFWVFENGFIFEILTFVDLFDVGKWKFKFF